MAKKTTTKEKSGKKSPISGFIHGRWLSSQFFARYWGIILSITVLLVLYIATRYQCLAEMENIQKLEDKLSIVHSEQVRERALYKSNTREIAIRERLEKAGLDLRERERPPYHIKLNP